MQRSEINEKMEIVPSMEQNNSKTQTRAKKTVFLEKSNQRKQKYRSNPENRAKDNEKMRLKRLEKKKSDTLFSDEMVLLKEKIVRMEKRMIYLETLATPPQTSDDVVSALDSLDSENEESMSWWQELEKNVKLFKSRISNLHRIIGVDNELFKQLALDFEPDFVNLNWDGTKKQNVTHIKTLKPKTALFLTLLWLRTYPTMYFMQLMFGVHERTLARVLKRSLRALELTLEVEQVFGHNDDLEAKKRPEDEGTILEKIVCWVDGTLVKTYRSMNKFAQNEKDPLFSGKHRQTGQKILLICDNQGHIMWNTQIFPGSRNDQGIWNDLGLRETFKDKDFGIGGDMGFFFNKQADAYEIIGIRPTSIRDKNMDPEQREIVKMENWMISNARVIIENVIGRLKQWKIIDGLCRHFHPNRVGTSKQRNVFDLNVIIEILCGIHNRDLKYHPMR